MVILGDRGMITTARITALKKVGGLGWLTALRAPQIAVLAADTGPLQMSLFDEQNFAEISHPDYPGERRVACRNPALADLRGRNRLDLLTATEKALAPIQAAVQAGKLTGADKIGLRVGKVLGRHKMAKHFQLTITDTTLTVTRNQPNIDTETALDGIYVIRSTVTGDELVGFPSYRGDIALRRSAVAENRRKFDRDFREGAVRIVRETGKPIARVARDLGINEGTLGNWIARDRQARVGGNGALSEDERAELVRLRRENAELVMERDVLKRSVALWVKDAMAR